MEHACAIHPPTVKVSSTVGSAFLPRLYMGKRRFSLSLSRFFASEEFLPDPLFDTAVLFLNSQPPSPLKFLHPLNLLSSLFFRPTQSKTPHTGRALGRLDRQYGVGALCSLRGVGYEARIEAGSAA